MMRVMLYQAAQVMLTRTNKWSWLKAWAMKIARQFSRMSRHGPSLPLVMWILADAQLRPGPREGNGAALKLPIATRGRSIQKGQQPTIPL
jgi:hypothetical protein